MMDRTSYILMWDIVGIKKFLQLKIKYSAHEG